MMQPDTTIQNRYHLIYAIEERPGGQVYRARDEQTGKLVLVSVLPMVDAGEREEVELSARQLALIEHKALLPLIAHFAEGGSYVLVSEDPGGQDLERALRARGTPFPEAEVLTQASTLLDLLEHLHNQKPPFYIGELWLSDVWVTEQGAWRLAPYTMVRPLSHTSSPYRAPELAEPDAVPDGATDMYAISALLYHMLTGWAPPATEQRTAGMPLNGPRVLNPQLSVLAEQALLRGLEQRAANRYQNPRELRLALETVQMMAGRSLGLGPDVLQPDTPPQPVTPPLSELPPALAAPSTPASQPPSQPGIYPAPAPAPLQPAGTYPPPGQPYRPGIYPAPAPPHRGMSTGCLVALAVVLTLIVIAIGIVLILIVTGAGGLLFGGGGPLAAINSLAPARPGEATAVPTPAPAGQSLPPVATVEPAHLGPKAITLQNAQTITRTHEITSSVIGATAYAPDGSALAVGIDNSISVLSISTMQERVQLTGHSRQIIALAWSPDSKLLASGAVDDTAIRLWDAATGRLVRTLEGHTGWVRALAFSPDGKLLASGATDKTIRLWNPADGTLERTLNGHTDWVGNLAFSPDGKAVASSSRDGTVRRWNVETGQQDGAFSFRTELDPNISERYWTTGLAYAPNGKLIAVGDRTGAVHIIDPATGAELRKLEGHTNLITIRGLAFTPDSKTLLSASWDGTIRAWDPETGAQSGLFEGHQLHLFGISISPDGQSMASTSNEEGLLFLWDLPERRRTRTLRIGQGLIMTLAYAPDSKLLGMLGYNGLLQIYRGADQTPQLLEGASAAPQPLAFLPDNRLVTISDQRRVVILSRSNAAARILEGLDGTPLSVATSRDGTIIVAGSSTGQIGVWDAAGTATAPKQTFNGNLTAILGLTISGDGSLIAAAGPPTDPKIEIWDVAQRKVVHELDGLTGGISGVAFQPRGALIAAADFGGSLFIWNAQDGALIRTIKATIDQQRFVGLNFSPDGTMLAAGSSTGQIVFLNAGMGTPAAQILVPDGSIVALTFSPDGQQLAVSVRNEANSVYIYTIP